MKYFITKQHQLELLPVSAACQTKNENKKKAPFHILQEVFTWPPEEDPAELYLFLSLSRHDPNSQTCSWHQ